MRYLCLVYQDDSSGDALPENMRDAIAGEVLDHGEELGLNGYLIASAPLQSAQAVTTIRVRSGRVSVSEGPLVESKAQPSGFYLIDARDLNDAIRVVSKMPSARFGCVEVRPLKEINPQ